MKRKLLCKDRHSEVNNCQMHYCPSTSIFNWPQTWKQGNDSVEKACNKTLKIYMHR